MLTLNKTKAALQSCQCHYQIFKQSQDITLIVAVNYRAKFCAQWSIGSLVDNSLFSWQSVKLRFAPNPLIIKDFITLRTDAGEISSAKCLADVVPLVKYGIFPPLKTTDLWFKNGRNLPFNPNQLIFPTLLTLRAVSRCEENRISVMMNFSKALKSALEQNQQVNFSQLNIEGTDFIGFFSQRNSEPTDFTQLLWKSPKVGFAYKTLILSTSSLWFADSRSYKNSGGQPFGSSLAFLRWRRLISLSKAATTNCPVLSPGSFHSSIESAMSCGTLAAIVCDFPLTALVAMFVHSIKGVQQYGRNKKSVQHLTCSTPCLKLVFNTLCFQYTNTAKPGSVTSTNRASDHKPLYEVTVMADQQHTQTHPEFTWRFLSTSERYPAAKPLVIYVNASSEQEARDTMPGVNLIFAARLPLHAFQVMEVRHV